MNKKKVNFENVHWADNFAQKAIDSFPNYKEYIVESGVTPSGIIHVGHFREMITMEMIRRAFEKKGKKSRFLYSWDSYDAFRKVPKNIPEKWNKYLRLPLNKVPDPFGCHGSFAEHFMKEGEDALNVFNFPIEYQYQHKLQTSGIYADGIKTILQAEQKNQIQEILNRYRQEPLKENWTSATIFCEKCSKDTTKILNYNNEYEIEYRCDCGYENKIDFRKTPIVKLLFRTDWPMRWAYYGVTVEGGGKDYATPGSPWFSGNIILNEIFKKPKLIGPFHNFVRMKGSGGKISSSKGDGATTKDLLEIYSKELVLYLFTGTRPNAEFDISFDLDVIKIYEDYDKLERLYYDLEKEKNPKMLANKKRIYELSMPGGVEIQKQIPFQPSFRHLSVVAQANDFDYKKVEKYYLKDLKTNFDKKRLKERFSCVKNWLEKYAPEEMRFSIQNEIKINLDENEKKLLIELRSILKTAKEESELIVEFKELSKRYNLELKEFFKLIYMTIIGKEKGPKLSGLLFENKEKVLLLLKTI